MNGSFKKGLFSSISHEYQRKVSSVGCQVMGDDDSDDDSDDDDDVRT